MLKIKTKIGPSQIHGMGLFADQFIPKGTVTWQYDPGYDHTFTKEQIEKLNPIAKDFMYFYTYFDHDLGKFVLCSDSQKYINHSENPKKRNIHSSPKQDISSADIQPGEELLCDYFLFDQDYFNRHNMDRSKLI